MNTMTIDLMEAAKQAGFEIWLGEEANRGWFTCEWTGKKLRGADAQTALEAQAEFHADFQVSQAKEQFEAEEAAEPKAPRKGKAVITDVKVMDHKAEEGDDTLGVLHANGMIDRITDKLAVHLEIKMIEGKPVKMTTVKCADCGTERDIKVQDAFQVKRCEECQKKHRNRKRAERRRQQRAERAEAKAGE